MRERPLWQEQRHRDMRTCNVPRRRLRSHTQALRDRWFAFLVHGTTKRLPQALRLANAARVQALDGQVGPRPFAIDSESAKGEFLEGTKMGAITASDTIQVWDLIGLRQSSTDGAAKPENIIR